VSARFYLAAIEHVLQESVVQINGCKLLKLSAELVAKFIYHEGQEIFHKLQVIYENLEQILDPHFLVGLKLKLLESLAFKNFFVLGVFH
jgi:hypothetical protein